MHTAAAMAPSAKHPRPNTLEPRTLGLRSLRNIADPHQRAHCGTGGNRSSQAVLDTRLAPRPLITNSFCRAA
ncbi:hypothetical protein E2C01_014720 [Portunus trituberculatus]|uniref:Uncharacterized protein n=1 Tax=Portunus trituberculatus TaxID=210409 RepID=A0A5B7DL87_PORTR|nr:hypothetical protein [Portunus trituberculatus]